jgi:hypothetical protein
MRLSNGRRAPRPIPSMGRVRAVRFFVSRDHDLSAESQSAPYPNGRPVPFKFTCIRSGRLKANLVETTSRHSHLQFIATLAFNFPRYVDV